MNPLSLLPQPYAAIARIALPIAAIVGAAVVGNIHGHRAQATVDVAKWQPPMIRATAALNLSAERIRRARAEALAADLAHARAVEAAHAQATQETASEYQTRLAAALAAADRRVRNAAQPQAAGGGSGVAGVSVTPDSAGRADGAGPASVMAADERACATAVTMAEAWQDWWGRVSR